MTRIGKVTVDYGAAQKLQQFVGQDVIEDGNLVRALFSYDRCLVAGGALNMAPGAINRVTHVRYRRV